MTDKRLALALGGGGARGIAHIAMLEAIDDLGLKPAALAGTSMGAIYAAAYASGLSGREIHELTLASLRDRRKLLGWVLESRAGRFTDLLQGFANPVLIDSERFTSLFLPEAVAMTFAEATVPLTIVAADYYAQKEVAFTQGDLRRAVAASIAIPGLFKPVQHDDRVLVDGGAVNPLPYDHLMGQGHVVVAIDVTGGPVKRKGRDTSPGAWDAMFGTVQILQNTITEQKLRRTPPDILIRPNVDLFRALDLFEASVILRLAQPAREELKRKLEAVFDPDRSRAVEAS